MSVGVTLQQRAGIAGGACASLLRVGGVESVCVCSHNDSSTEPPHLVIPLARRRHGSDWRRRRLPLRNSHRCCRWSVLPASCCQTAPEYEHVWVVLWIGTLLFQASKLSLKYRSVSYIVSPQRQFCALIQACVAQRVYTTSHTHTHLSSTSKLLDTSNALLLQRANAVLHPCNAAAHQPFLPRITFSFFLVV